MNLDLQLVRDAELVLGTTQMTETVHRALQEVIDRHRRRVMLTAEFPGLSADSPVDPVEHPTVT